MIALLIKVIDVQERPSRMQHLANGLSAKQKIQCCLKYSLISKLPVPYQTRGKIKNSQLEPQFYWFNTRACGHLIKGDKL